MPIRIASLSRRITRNGASLHRAMEERIHSLGADHAPSEAEQALVDERHALKEEREKRQARASQPKPKAKKEPKESKEAKAHKAHGPSRAEKHATKAAALEAARKAAKKSART